LHFLSLDDILSVVKGVIAMPDLLANEPVPLPEQIICVKREIGLRERVYPRFVAKGTMTPERAERELTVMRAVLETLTKGLPN